MAGIRSKISASLRWSVFYRDGFTCRYCGAQAGEDGVELVIDHVISVAEGGDNRIDNLATACRGCNSGKGAKSLRDIPTAIEVAERVRLRRENIEVLRSELRESAESLAALRQEIVNIKCSAYQTDSTEMQAGEADQAIRLLREFKSSFLVEWYGCAASAGVPAERAIMYVCGCARLVRRKPR